MYDEAELSDDRFLSGRLSLVQPRQGYRAATDPVLLAAACPAQAGDTVLDLGCGVGAAALCLGWRVEGLCLYGLELQPAYADLARRNAHKNRIALRVYDGDVSAMPVDLRIGFDHVITNPPYYAPSGTPSPIASRAAAMHIAVPLKDWVSAAGKRLSSGGWLTLICRVDGLPEVLAGMGGKLGSVSILPLQARAGQPAQRLIVRARKGGCAPLRLLAPLRIHSGAAHEEDHGGYTTLVSAVLRQGQSLARIFD